MIIQHNIAAINAHRQLSGNNNIVSKNLEKLSSGFRINKAGDDAAGLAISEKMRAQIKGLERASSNAQDGISLIQTAEGALTEVHSMLNRMVELSVQSANGTYKDDVDRDALQSEVNSLTAEIDRVAQATNFNGINLIDGSLGSSTAKITKSAAAAAAVKFKDVDATKGKYAQSAASTMVTVGKGDYYELNVSYNVNGKSQSAVVRVTQEGNTALTKDDIKNELAKALRETSIGTMFEVATTGSKGLTFTAKEAGLGAPMVTGMTGALTTKSTGVTVVDAKIATGTKTDGTDAKTRVNFGSLTAIGTNASKETIENNTITINGQKFAFAASADAAKELGSDINVVIAATPGATAAMASMSALIEQKTGIKASASRTGPATGAGHSIDVTLKNTTGGGGSGLELQVGDTNAGFNKVSVSVDDMSASGLGINAVDVSTKGAAGAAQQIVKDAINKVSTNRGNLGALQNRLEHTISNLGVTTENMTAAESRVRDVDMAKEMMMFTKNNVLTQAAQAMLAQANQQPQGVLQLLR